MSILNTQHTPPAPSKEQRLMMVTNKIKRITKNTYLDLVKIQSDGVNAVWHDSNLTPQEIVDALGADATKLFQFHGKLTDFLIQAAQLDGAAFVPTLPTNAFVINSDGTITVTEDPYIL